MTQVQAGRPGSEPGDRPGASPRADPDSAPAAAERSGEPGTKPLSGRTVLFVALGPIVSTEFVEALERSGATVQQVEGVTTARRSLAQLGLRGGVLVCAGLQLVPPVELATAFRHHDAAVIVSAAASFEDRTALVEHGADCVLSSLLPDQAVALLAALLRRAPVRPVAVRELEVGPLRIELEVRTATVSGTPVHLTVLEFDLLAYFMAHRGEVIGREQLRADVWGYDIGGLETVTVHVRRLRAKIEPDPANPSMITTAWGMGYRFVGGVAPAVSPPEGSLV